MTIGEKIKAIRENQGLSQSEIERRTGIKREYLSKIENCELKNPTYNTLQKIAKGLGVTFLYLEGYSGSDNSSEAFRENQEKIKKEISVLDKEISGKETLIKIKIKEMERLKLKRLFNLSQLVYKKD